MCGRKSIAAIVVVAAALVAGDTSATLIFDPPQPIQQVRPLARFQDGHRLPAELLVSAEERSEADVDVVVVVAHRQRVRAEVEQRDDLVRAHRALEAHQSAHGLLGDAAALLVADDRDVVDPRDVDGVARSVLDTLPDAVM